MLSPPRTSTPPSTASLVGGWTAIILSAWAGLPAIGGDLPSPSDARLYVSYAAKPDPQAILAHNICILDPAADAPLSQGRAMGHTHLAYVSVVEVLPGTSAAQKAQKRGIPVVDRNADWNSSVLDITHAGWEDWLVEDVVGPAIEKGYDGVFLDTLDSAVRIVMKRPSRARAVHDAMVGAIRRIHRQFPGKRIMVNRAFRLVEEDVSAIIDGVLIEGLYQTWSPGEKTYAATGIEGTEWLLSHIARIQEKKLPVFVVDYVPPADADLAHATAKRIRTVGCVPFVTTPDLQGEELAPLREVPRRIAVLHGWRPQEDPRPPFPADTLTTELLQAPLEWLGCEVEFFDAGKGPPPDLSPLRYRGIVLDEALRLPAEREEAFADWMLAQRQRGLKLLFAGSIPFTREHVVRRVFRELSLTGGNQVISFEGRPSITSPDRSMLGDDPSLSAPVPSCRAVTAPKDARVMLTVQGRDRNGTRQRSDALFLTSWGGALLLRDLPGQSYQRMDVHAFVGSWLGIKNAFPAPDVTTRDGMRAFFSHFDGDGFVSRSAIQGNPLCGEVIRDRILKSHPLPVTVSVIEAEIEAQVTGLDPRAVPLYREVARSIFALPNVQPASHTYSHPYRWLERDPAGEALQPPGNYELKPWANYAGSIDVDREIRGSIEYLNRVLVPRDKQAEILLWSGDCRPGAESLRLCRELGVENMNGGRAFSRHLPGLAGVPSSHTFWDGELQVFAANHNDFMFAPVRPAPFFESSANVIAAFERTESPRRLKPVNPCGDFRDAAYVSSVHAMERVFDWCMTQPLHAITARQYARIVRDAAATRLYESGPGRWLICNGGHLRTFRLPATVDDPDIAASNGVTGWLRLGEWLYVHTRGAPVTELALSARPAPHLRLAQCSAEIEFRSLGATKADFRVSDLRPVQASFAGAPPHAACELVVNGQPMRARSDGNGIVTLSLPATADVTLDFSAARLANRN